MSEEIGRRGKHAVVIGASMGGLLAARTLADHFDQVTLLERDTFPPRGVNRRGVPQGRHIHVLLERGRQIMEDYLPGLAKDLASAGAVVIADAGLSIRWFSGGAYHQPGPSGVSGTGVSRPTLEALVRARVLALPNIRAAEGSKVLGVMADGEPGRIRGVRLLDRRNGGQEQTLPAELVVDASGRGSRSPAWLEEMGYERPAEDKVEINMGYTTYYYRRQRGDLGGLGGVVLGPTPPNRRLAVLLAQDGSRWVLTLGGYLGDHVPSDYQGFLNAVRKLPVPQIYQLVKDAEPLSEPATYKFRANLRRRYEKLARFPEGYLVIGDALCSFNPINGQGMTVAAMEAKALQDCLAVGHRQLAKRFFHQASKIVDVSWDAAVGSDLGYAEVEGPRTPAVRFLNWYIGKLHKAAHQDADVSAAYLKVINMVAPLTAIMHPHIVWRVLRGNLRPALPGSPKALGGAFPEPVIRGQ